MLALCLVASAWASNTTTWTPEPDWALAPAYAVVSGAAVGDFDADGADDLVYAVEDRVVLYVGGPGGLSDTAAREWDVTVATVLAADVSGDGVDDLVIGAPEAGDHYSGELRVYLGDPLNGLDTTPDHVSVGNPGSQLGSGLVAAGDLDRDGHDDLFAGAWSGFGLTWIWWRGTPTGLVRGSWSTDGTLSTAPFVAGDVTGDGYGDIAHSTPTETVRVYLGSAAGPGLIPDVSIDGPPLPQNLVMADVTGDGIDELLLYEDLAVPEPLLHVYTTDGVSLSPTPLQTVTIPGGEEGNLSRVDVDGVQYLVLGHLESAWIAPALSLPPDAASWGSPWAVASSSEHGAALSGFVRGLAGDLDGDGLGDLVFSSSVGWEAGGAGPSPLVDEEVVLAVWHAAALPGRPSVGDTGGDTGGPAPPTGSTGSTGPTGAGPARADRGRSGCGCGGAAPVSWLVVALAFGSLRRR